MKKVFSLLTVLMAVILVLSACSSSQGTSSSTSGSSTLNESTPIASTSASNTPKEVSLTLSSCYTTAQISSNASSAVFHQMTTLFGKDYPNVKLDITEMTDDNYATKLQAEATANDLPDVFMLKGSWTNTFVNNGNLAKMDSVLESSGIKDKYREGIFNPVTINGNIYGMPLQYAVTSLIFYNADMWKSIGYDKFPDNWNDILAAIPKFQAKNITPFALGDQDNWEYESCILSSLGDRFTGTDWTNNIIANNGKAKFTDTDFVNSLNFTEKIIKAGLFNPNVTSINNSQAESLYCQGKAAATIDGYWNIVTVNKNATPDVLKATKLALLPAVDGGKGNPNTTSGGPGWFLAVNGSLTGDKLDAAEKYVAYMTEENYSKMLETQYGLIGAVDVGAVNVSQFPQLTQDYISLLSSGVTTTPIYDIQMDGSVIDVMNTGLQGMLSGTVKPADLAAQIQAAQDKLSK